MKGTIRKLSLVILTIFLVNIIFISSTQLVQASTTNIKDYTSSDYFTADYFKMHINDDKTISITGKSALNKQNFCLEISNSLVSNDTWGDLNADGSFTGVSNISSLADGDYKITLYLGGWSTAAGIPIKIEGGIANFTTSDSNTINKSAIYDLSSREPNLYLNTTYINATASQLTVIKSKALEITQNATSNYEKIRLIHDWIANNIYYNEDGLNANDLGDNSPYAVLTTQKAVCQGYAELSEAMLRSIGIPSAILIGRSIQYYEAWNTIDDPNTPDHAWNAAYADGRWIVFDATWNSGNEFLNSTFINYGLDKYTYFDTNLDALSVNHRILNIYNDVSPINIISFSSSKYSPQSLGGSVTFTVGTSGGIGTIKSKFQVFDGTTWTTIQDYSAEKSVTWTPTKAGKYTISATCDDSGGRTITCYKNFEITENTNLTIAAFTANCTSPQLVGTKITLNTISTGGVGTLQTKFAIYDGTSWTLLKAYSTDSTVIWTPTKAGKYQINATVIDSTGKTVTKSYYYTISTELKMDTISANVISPQTVGTQIKLSATSAGGVGTLQTKFAIYDGTSWTLLKAYSTDSTVIWTPTKAGKYQINATVIDSTGKTVTKSYYYTINTELKMDTISANVISPQTVGTQIKLSATSAGGVGTLQTKFAIYDGTSWTLLKAYSTDSTVIWTPTKAGKYQINATVIDSTGKTVTKSYYYTINS